MVSPALITVIHNGVVVQHATQALGPTSWVHHKKTDPNATEGHIGLQDHGNPVRFRNIWVRKLDTAQTAGAYPESRPFTDEEKQKFVGKYEKNQEVKLIDGTLYLHTLQQDMELVAYADGTYSTRESAGTVEFESGSDGKVEAIKFKFDAGYNGRFARQ
jgi:hypothetical protein